MVSVSIIYIKLNNGMCKLHTEHTRPNEKTMEEQKQLKRARKVAQRMKKIFKSNKKSNTEVLSVVGEGIVVTCLYLSH